MAQIDRTSDIKTLREYAQDHLTYALHGEVGEVLSPCISVCVIDEPSGWCAGCLRSLDDIAAWSQADEMQKLAIRKQCIVRAQHILAAE